QRAPLLVRHADDVFGMVAEEHAFAPCLRMRADDRMIHGWRGAPLLVGHRFLAVTPVARKIEAVHGAQSGDAHLPCVVEAIVSVVHVAEMRLATPALYLHHLTVNDG